LRIFFLTQEDPFYLPIFFSDFLKIRDAELNIVGVSVFDPFNSQANWRQVIRDFFLLYGLRAFLHQGMLFTLYKTLSLIPILNRSTRLYSVRSVFRSQNIPIIPTTAVNSLQYQSTLNELNIDLIISVACPKILKKKILRLPRKGCINLHAGYLPQYRGIAPLFWAMLHKEKTVAISIHFMNEKVDDGEIIGQTEIPIESTDSLHSLYLKVINEGPISLNEVVKRIREDRVVGIENDEHLSTYYGFPSYEDGKAFRRDGLRFL
jgi:methionyl-tRNA formyltransferase